MDRRVAVGILGVGVLLTGTGVVLLYRSRTRSADKILGRAPKRKAIESKSSNGMTLKHYRSRMPINERVGVLQDIAHKSVQDPEMRKLALQITRHCPARDSDCEAKAIYNWTKRSIRYTGDIGPHKLGRNGPVEGVDLFQSAARTVEFGGGDCDDHSILNCTLALHNGMACKFRVTSPTRKNGEDFTHIYAMVGQPKNSPKKWVAIDTTLERGKYGTEAPFGKARDYVA